jgi:hypothetical protein
MFKQSLLITAILFCLSSLLPAGAQSGKGTISGHVKDSGGAVLQGAKVLLQPQIRPVSTEGQGEFTVTEVTPGEYSVTISYVGFEPYMGSITVVAGQTAHMDAVLKVGSANDDVIVTADSRAARQRQSIALSLRRISCRCCPPM